MNRISIATIMCVLTVVGWSAADDAGLPLLDTKPLEWPEEDLSVRLMDGAHRFIDGRIRASRNQRSRFWKYNASSRQAYEALVAENRQQLRQIIGAVDLRLPVSTEQFGDDVNPACVAETPQYHVFQVRWPVLNGVFGEGLFVQQRAVPRAHVVVIPDADQTPEQILGLAPGVGPESQFARRLAEHGFELVIPTMVSRRKLDTDDPGLKQSDQTYREWIYRQAFHMGRHIIGYEVQKVLAAVDWFEKRDASARIGVMGYAEGGLIAFYAAAIDTWIDAVLVSGYFDSREGVWAEPICRNVWSLLERFGDAEIASLILPRSLVVEHSVVAAVTGQKGDWGTPEYTSVSKEFERIPIVAGFTRPTLVHDDGHPTGPGSVRALQEFARRLGVQTEMALSGEIPTDRRSSFQPDRRHSRAVQQLEGHVQSLVRESEHVRDRFFLYEVMPELAEHRWSTQRLAGYSQPTTAAFRKWLEEKYRTDATLRKAWSRNDVKLDRAAIPTRAERLHIGDGVFRDARHQNVVDFYLFWNELIPETIDYFAKIVKQAGDHRNVVGAFYGYMYEFVGDPKFGHNALGRFLASNSLDFIAVTASYFTRQAGSGGDYARSPAASVRLHNKLWYHDNDAVSFLAKKRMEQIGYREDDPDWTRNLSTQLDSLGYTDTPVKSQWMYRRGLGFALCNSMFQAWFDLHGGYFDDSQLMAEIGSLNNLAARAASWDRSSIAEILVVSDEKSCARLRSGSPLLRELLLTPQNQLIRIGAPVDHILLEDLRRMDATRYKLIIFLNCFEVSTEERTVIEYTLKCDGKHLVWCSAAGWFCEVEGSSQLCRDLTGFGVIRSDSESNSFVLERTVTKKQLASREVDLLRKDTWTSIWAPTAALPVADYRALAKMAGVHIFNNQDDVLYANKSLICLNAKDRGSRILRFPTTVKLWDALEDEPIAISVEEWRQDFELGETRLLHWEQS